MPEELYTEKGYESILLRAFGNSPKLRIIDFYLDNPLFDFTKKEVIEALGMSKQTFYKYFEDLEDLAVVKVSRKIGRAKLYKINLENPMVKLVREYETELSTQMAEQEKVKEQKPLSMTKVR
ncbi:MAG: winged helix-turn-helix domain-containing protein [Candidatus Hadarchaeota archaeon]|nr:winged helix-turn-helix domain-containing protein [Candidatus Hadarchaeota archaeon]